MTVYVDDMRAEFRRMKMCHMIADTVGELHAMADRLGLRRGWFQRPASGPHYDLSLTRRQQAVAFGAKEITLRQCACMMARWRLTGELGDPETAVDWMRTNRQGTIFNSKPIPTPDDLLPLAHGKTHREQGGSSI